MKRLILLHLLAVLPLAGQEVYSRLIRNLRVTGETASQVPVALPDSRPVTITFDYDDAKPADLRLKFFHCDKDWNVTQNSFVNEELRNSTKSPLPYRLAPKGVQHYRFTYSVQVPGFAGIEKFSQSGNYKFEVWDKEQSELLAEGRFLVAEQFLDSAVTITNRSLPSEVAPKNQVHKIVVNLTIPDDGRADLERIIPSFVKVVDVYRNRELYSPYRIDLDERNPNAYVDGWGTNRLRFIVDNVPAGNEYRRLDVRDVDVYPPGKVSRSRDGADVVRYLWQGPADQDGVSYLVQEGRYADYDQFQFELIREKEEGADEFVYVVGDFNEWKPNESWKMHYDPAGKRYVLIQWLRRGVYDYQYVRNDGDTLTFEGNDWRTVNVYSAFIYYHDVRFGGFDRIIGFTQGRSPGGVHATSR